MRNRSISRLDSLRSGRFVSGWSVFENEVDVDRADAPPVQEIDVPSSESARKAQSNATAESMGDVALALVLNEIAHQARSITAATGSAVLLIRDGVAVCSACSGATAREVSAHLGECSARSDPFWKDGAPQLWDDIEADPRFDPASWQRLGVRSFMIVPVQNHDKAVVAIVQTFSSRPQAFSKRDVLLLQGLGRRIADHIELAERTLAPKVRGTTKPEIPPKKTTLSSFAHWFDTWKVSVLGERWNLLLGGVTIPLAILLGWTLGRSERESAHRNTRPSPAPVVNQLQIAATSADPNITSPVEASNHPATPVDSLGDSPLVNAEREQFQPRKENHINQLKSKHTASKVKSSAASSGDLVIFENGKEVFPTKSPESQPFRNAPSKNKREPQSHESSVSVSEDVAAEHLLNRIEPDYPEYAREQHLEGTVILNVHVGKDGRVRSLSRVTGDSRLTLLAAKAVRQWKFAPLVRDGAPMSFESQITLNFVLP
jgi:TonB family protein